MPNVALLDRPAVIFVGQNPGFHEDKQNEPFVGPSGNMVKKVMVEGISLLSLASVYFTNTARCYTPADAPPKDKQYRICAENHLPPDFAHIAAAHKGHPVCIVCLGAPAAKWVTFLFTGEKPKQRDAFAKQCKPVTLSLDFDEDATLYLFYTYHPAAVLRDNNLIHSVEDHMQILADFLGGSLVTPSKPRFVPLRDPPSRSPEYTNDTSRPTVVGPTDAQDSGGPLHS